jgi:hypothetical protein
MYATSSSSFPCFHSTSQQYQCKIYQTGIRPKAAVDTTFIAPSHTHTVSSGSLFCTLTSSATDRVFFEHLSKENEWCVCVWKCVSVYVTACVVSVRGYECARDVCECLRDGLCMLLRARACMWVCVQLCECVCECVWACVCMNSVSVFVSVYERMSVCLKVCECVSEWVWAL